MSGRSMTSPRQSPDIPARNAGATLCRATPLARSWGRARAVFDVARRWWCRHPLFHPKRASIGAAIQFAAESTSAQRSTGARQKLALPCQRVTHDGLQVVEIRLPFEQRTGTVGSRHDLCRVPGPPADERNLEVDARDALYGLDHLEHGETAAVAAIERGGDATAPQIRQRIAMRAHEIGHVNVISDASAVRCRVVGAEDIYFWPQTERSFDRDLDEVGGAFGRLAGAAERVGAGDVEVTQDHVAQPVGAAGVAQHDLGHQLRRAI